MSSQQALWRQFQKEMAKHPEVRHLGAGQVSFVKSNINQILSNILNINQILRENSLSLLINGSRIFRHGTFRRGTVHRKKKPNQT